ncbi:hypothetical protein ACFRNT_10635 [Streptomyces sp. NPDC056697]
MRDEATAAIGPTGQSRDTEGMAFSPDGRLIAGNDTKHHKVYLWKNPE